MTVPVTQKQQAHPLLQLCQWLSELDICFLSKVNELLLIFIITDVLFMQI